MAGAARLAFLLFLLLSLPCCVLSHAATTTHQAEVDDEARLLLQIKRAWGDPPELAAWRKNDTAAARCCDWPVPEAICGLSRLTDLDLFNNRINGGFPTSLYRCTSLQYLSLSDNYLGGDLPHDIGLRLGENLTGLILVGNYFTGAIPKSLCQLRKLEDLELDYNNFTGTIPTELGDLTSLTMLAISRNKFEPGELPASFKNLTKLRNMPDLVTLDLAAYNLTGRIPPGIWSMKNLLILLLSSNSLTGEVVVDGAIGAMNLMMIHLSANRKLSGPIPEGFGMLHNLEELSLHSNNFSGKIPPSIGRLRSLSRIALHNNSLTGILPPELGQHSPELSHINVSDNEITGPIPEGLCDNGNLYSFVAGNNSLNGSIPERLAGCTTLRNLQLGNNTLSGGLM